MKKAASLIELIISIVVMGIMLMSLPLILAQVQKIDESSMQQEVINAIKSNIYSSPTYRWDRKSSNMDSGNSHILDADGDADLQRVVGTNYRKGSISRRFFDNNTPPSNAGGLGLLSANETGGFDTTAQAMNADYTFTISLNRSVGYVSDDANYTSSSLGDTNATVFILGAPHAGISSNLKQLIVTATVNGQTTTLKAFSANIGEPNIITRTY